MVLGNNNVYCCHGNPSVCEYIGIEHNRVRSVCLSKTTEVKINHVMDTQMLDAELQSSHGEKAFALAFKDAALHFDQNNVVLFLYIFGNVH